MQMIRIFVCLLKVRPPHEHRAQQRPKRASSASNKRSRRLEKETGVVFSHVKS
jgi:hypothetical protein